MANPNFQSGWYFFFSWSANGYSHVTFCREVCARTLNIHKLFHNNNLEYIPTQLLKSNYEESLHESQFKIWVCAKKGFVHWRTILAERMSSGPIFFFCQRDQEVALMERTDYLTRFSRSNSFLLITFLNVKKARERMPVHAMIMKIQPDIFILFVRNVFPLIFESDFYDDKQERHRLSSVDPVQPTDK